MLAPLLSVGLILYLLFPFLFLLIEFRFQEWPDGGELWWAFKNSFLQALGSAFFSVLLGLWAALGLVGFPRHQNSFRRGFLEVLCLAPNFLPSLFVLLATLNLLDPFPMGIAGIVVIHTLINLGLVAVLLARAIESRLGGLTEQAYVQGSSKFYFLTKIFFPILKKDIFLIGLFVFIICFGSFSVPLIVGGGRGTTLEVLIYEKIRLSSHWGEAVLIALLQSVFIFLVSLFSAKRSPEMPEYQANFRLIRSVTGPFVVLLTAGFILWGYGQGVLEGLSQLSFFYEIQSAVVEALGGTLLIGISVGGLSFFLLMLIAWIGSDPLLNGILRGYMAPSTALTCFSILLLGPNDGAWPFLKIPLAFMLISLASLYRLGWESRLESLRGQVAIAKTLGASRGLIFKSILLPQISAGAGLLSGLAAAWATGDFAVSRILAQRDLSLAMMTQNLMSGYRLSQSTVLSLLVMLCGLICFFIFFWGGRVLSRKFTP